MTPTLIDAAAISITELGKIVNGDADAPHRYYPHINSRIPLLRWKQRQLSIGAGQTAFCISYGGYDVQKRFTWWGFAFRIGGLEKTVVLRDCGDGPTHKSYAGIK